MDLYLEYVIKERQQRILNECKRIQISETGHNHKAGMHLKWTIGLSRFLISILIISFILVTILFHVGCATSELINVRKNVQRMSDSELLHYYYGINDRIKDVANSEKMEERPGLTEHDHLIRSQTFFVGGEGYGLIQKREVILEELNKRGISP